MPLFRLETNQTRCHVPKDYHKTTTELMAKLLEKPPERCSVTVITDVNMSRGGTNEPCGFATLLSIGHLGLEENKRHSAALSAHVERYLGIPKNRLVIRFIDEKPENLGHMGTTFAELLQEYEPKKKNESDSDDDTKKKGKKDTSRGCKDKREGSKDTREGSKREGSKREGSKREGSKDKKGSSVSQGGGKGKGSVGSNKASQDEGKRKSGGNGTPNQDQPAEGAESKEALPEEEVPPAEEEPLVEEGEAEEGEE